MFLFFSTCALRVSFYAYNFNLYGLSTLKATRRNVSRRTITNKGNKAPYSSYNGIRFQPEERTGHDVSHLPPSRLTHTPRNSSQTNNANSYLNGFCFNKGVNTFRVSYNTRNKTNSDNERHEGITTRFGQTCSCTNSYEVFVTFQMAVNVNVAKVCRTYVTTGNNKAVGDQTVGIATANTQANVS